MCQNSDCFSNAHFWQILQRHLWCDVRGACSIYEVRLFAISQQYVYEYIPMCLCYYFKYRRLNTIICNVCVISAEVIRVHIHTHVFAKYQQQEKWAALIIITIVIVIIIIMPWTSSSSSTSSLTTTTATSSWFYFSAHFVGPLPHFSNTFIVYKFICTAIHIMYSLLFIRTRIRTYDHTDQIGRLKHAARTSSPASPARFYSTYPWAYIEYVIYVFSNTSKYTQTDIVRSHTYNMCLSSMHVRVL